MYTSSITIDSVIDALAAFLMPFMQGGKVVRAQVNRVPMPENPIAVLTELRQEDIDLPYMNFQPQDNTTTLEGGKRVSVQIDFYGAIAGELCAVIKTAFRTGYGFDNMPQNIKPLYTDEGIQSPLITGEEQYESRWTLTVNMQYNPVITVPQQYADEAYPETVIAVDVVETF